MNGETLRRALRPHAQRIRSMIGRCVLSAIQDSGELQTVQAKLMGRLPEDVERFGEWGLLSRPPVGSEAVIAFLGESGSHGVIVGTENSQYRPKDADPGASGLYTTDSGTRVTVKPDGTIQIEASDTIRIQAGADVEIQGTGNVTVNGVNVTVTAAGLLTLLGDVQIEGRDWLNHQHNGVQSGGDQSGGVV